MIKSKITIICPVYNEGVAIPLFFDRIKPVEEILSETYDVDLLFCNNASSDGTQQAIEDIRNRYQNVYEISLSCNVGYQRSIECGLRNAKGDVFVIIDVDCEDPPEMITEFVTKYEDGYDIVYGERIDREEATWLKSLRKLFYRIMRSVADENIILDMAEFSLMTAEVRDAIAKDGSSFPFIRASIGRIGFNAIGIPYKRGTRIAGETHYNIVGMTIFAIAGILSSSTLLLRLPIYLLPFWCVSVVILAVKIVQSPQPWMFPTLFTISALYVGASIAFIGIYLARVYKNSLGRPNYIIRNKGTYLQK